MYNNTIEKLSLTINILDFTTDGNGFLIDPEDWSPLFAEKTLDLPFNSLGVEQLKVIHFIRDKFLRLGALPPMRTVCKASGLDKATLKQTFGSCLQLWKAAGLPQPDDELRAYMN